MVTAAIAKNTATGSASVSNNLVIFLLPCFASPCDVICAISQIRFLSVVADGTRVL
jgi:hypothetical protein